VKLRIGTRRSALALAQSEEVRARLAAVGVDTELVPMSTAGDRGDAATGSIAGMKGLWVNDIVRALRDGEVVHIHDGQTDPRLEPLRDVLDEYGLIAWTRDMYTRKRRRSAAIRE
jgi:hydroxymethylbilane synthase